METNTYRRMDYYIEALKDLFLSLDTNGWHSVFGIIPQYATIQDLIEVRDTLNGFPGAAHRLIMEIEETPPTFEETPPLLGYIHLDIKALRIPPGFWIFDKGPVTDSFRRRFRQLWKSPEFDELCKEICCGLYTLVFYYENLYRLLYESLQPGSKTNPIRREFPYCFPASEYTETLFIPTDLNDDQLSALYNKLVSAGYVEAGKKGDFLRCFDREADTPGRVYWRKKARSGKPNIRAVCDLLGLLGIQADQWGKYAAGLFGYSLNPSMISKADTRSGSAERTRLTTLFNTIQNQ